MKLVALRELGDLVRGRLPAFLTRPRTPANHGGYLPVFTFHSLEPASFEAKLRHLQRNGYRTVTLDDAVAHLRGQAALPDKAIVLTIDDARLSTWTVGLPLLRKYDMTATAFIIPGYTREGTPRPTIEHGAVACDEIGDRQTTCNWAEIEAMHRDGHVRIESHTTLHRRVMTAPRADVFLTPQYRNHPYLIPAPIDAREPWPEDAATTMLGAPLGPACPILSQDHAYDPPRDGSPPFLRDTADAQAWELRQARRIIEDRLPGKTVRHLCFPESAGTDRALQLARDAGYDSACWGLHDARTANRPAPGQGDPMRLGRLKHDYILCLPGEGRVSLPRTLWSKATRRLSGRTGF